MAFLLIHPALKGVAGLFASRGKELCLVGGAVRDMLRGKVAHDWDLATDAQPEEVRTIFAGAHAKVIPTGIKHGTVTVLRKGRSMEITTYRTEADYSDGRRPDQVSYSTSIEEDLSRRDFTMNAIALRLPEGKKIDPFGGEADIKARIIRCVGDPAKRFSEDGLRALRAARFAAQLSFTVEARTLAAIEGALETSAKVSAERVKDELEKMLMSRRPSIAFRLMEQTGLLLLFLPELARCRGVEQKGAHRFDVLDHSFLACDFAAETDCPLEVRLAALFHDLGKAATKRVDDSGEVSFHRHEAESEKLSREILCRLRFSNAVIEKVCHLTKEHMFHYTDDWSDAAARRFLARVGREHLADLYKLRRADSYASAGIAPPANYLLPLAERVERIVAEAQAISLKDLALSGRDLIAAGVPPGKIMGKILDELLEAVIEDPALNERGRLIEIAFKLSDKFAGR
ncbi:MAG: HD domain-containing protein [Treponema sp.]|nr:HD domain-containing protein [Treponema sp.]